MALKRRVVQNIFSDRASLVLRALLREPKRSWKILELSKEGVSFGLASMVLNRAEKLGYVERVRIGPGSYTRLINPELLLRDWTRSYSFDRNLHAFYHFPNKNFLKTAREYFTAHKLEYALTLFSGTRLISPYVKDDRQFLYLNVDPGRAEAFFRDVEGDLGLLKLVRGGNVCLTVPFYQSSVFKHSRLVGGHPVVSNLQLYLDLAGFLPGGPEEAEHFKEHLLQQGGPLA